VPSLGRASRQGLTGLHKDLLQIAREAIQLVIQQAGGAPGRHTGGDGTGRHRPRRDLDLDRGVPTILLKLRSPRNRGMPHAQEMHPREMRGMTALAETRHQPGGARVKPKVKVMQVSKQADVGLSRSNGKKCMHFCSSDWKLRRVAIVTRAARRNTTDLWSKYQKISSFVPTNSSAVHICIRCSWSFGARGSMDQHKNE